MTEIPGRTKKNTAIKYIFDCGILFEPSYAMEFVIFNT